MGTIGSGEIVLSITKNEASVTLRLFLCAPIICLMTPHNINQLLDEAQLAYVYRADHYVARRWDDVHQAVMLYQLPGGLFAELNYDVNDSKVTHLFAFEAGSEDDRLPDYAAFVKLPDWMGGES